jgi:hypothetical protein
VYHQADIFLCKTFCFDPSNLFSRMYMPINYPKIALVFVYMSILEGLALNWVPCQSGVLLVMGYKMKSIVWM